MKTTSKKIVKGFLLLAMFLVAVPAVAQAQQKMEYGVKQGETLFSISKKLGVNVAELKQWNGLENNNIAIGQLLIYYNQEENEVETLPPQQPGKSLINQRDVQENEFYNVKSGDNLYTIARNHNMSVGELKSLNNLESDIISVGQQLAVRKMTTGSSVTLSGDESTSQGRFSLYTVEQGENLASVLERFNMSEREFEKLNPQTNIQNLRSGQQVTVLIPPTHEFDNPYLQTANLDDLGMVSAIVYDDSETASTTTNGELYNPDALTAAHANIVLGKIIFVENPENGKGIYVKINDRITGPGIKLSYGAYESLGFRKNENAQVSIYMES